MGLLDLFRFKNFELLNNLKNTSYGIVKYYLEDNFSVNESSPLTSPRQAENIGEWTVVENDGSFAINNGRLEYTAQATNDVDDLKIYTTDTLNRDNIAIIMAVVDITSDFVAVGEFWGFSNDILPRVGDFTFLQSAANDALYPLNVDLGSVLQDNDTIFSVAVGNNGYFYRSRSGTTELMFVVDISSIASDVYAIFSNRSATGSVDSIRVAQLRESLFDPAISVASPNVGALDDWTDGDGFMEFDLDTLPSSGNIDINFRQQDTDNEWRIVMSSNGNFTLYEIVDASPTARANVSSVLANGQVIRLKASGNTITAWYDNTQAWSYTSANNFLRDTGFELALLGTGGAISNLKVWQAYARQESGLGSELVTDGDMEAVGTSAWSTFNNATLSKEDDSGNQVLRIARNGNNNPNAYQNILSTGTLYRATGRARSDGNAVPRLFGGGSVLVVWTGTNSTDWQTFDVYFYPDDVRVLMQSQTSTGVEYTEWDDLVVKEVQFIPDALGERFERVIE